jgi:hypothetical protein
MPNLGTISYSASRGFVRSRDCSLKVYQGSGVCRAATLFIIHFTGFLHGPTPPSSLDQLLSTHSQMHVLVAGCEPSTRTINPTVTWQASLKSYKVALDIHCGVNSTH